MEVVGIALGLGGVAILTSPGGLNPLGGVALVVVSAVAWAAGSLVNRYADLPASPIRMAGMQMMAGGVMMLSIGILIGELGRFEPPGDVRVVSSRLCVSGRRRAGGIARL